LPSEPEWLSVEVAIEINHILVTLTGERHLVRDRGLLEGAVARPQNAFSYGEEDVLVLAVRLLVGIAHSHPFEQGNKRPAFVAMVQFLNANDLDIAIDDSEHWADMVIALVEHRSTEEDFVRAIRPYLVPRP
jgi:death-on-curing protein